MDLFAKHGVANVSMQDIADRAETARSTVFKHYPQKHALLADFFMRLGTTTLLKAKEKPYTDFRSGMNALFEALGEECIAVQAVLREVAGMTKNNGPLASEEAEIDNHMILHISELIELGIKTGEVKSDLDVKEAAELLLCVMTETNHEAISRDLVQDLAINQRNRFEMLFIGLRATN